MNGQRSNTNTLYRRTNKGACLTIEKLQNGELFQFSVQAYSAVPGPIPAARDPGMPLVPAGRQSMPPPASQHLMAA